MVFSSKFLAKCSIYIAIGGMTSVMIMRSILIDKVRRQEYYQNAMKTLRSHEGNYLFHQLKCDCKGVILLTGAKMLLGEPIKDVGTDITDPNYADKEKAHFEVKVSGSKAKGSIFFWAEKPAEEEKWNVTRIELQLKDDDKRLLIKKPAENSTEVQSSASK